jgi:hypothetical protein
MIKNEKIAQYIKQKPHRTAEEVEIYLKFFAENYDEFEEVLKVGNWMLSRGGMKKYEQLAKHIVKNHGLDWGNGKEMPPVVVRNLHKLARRERDAHMPKRCLPPELNTVFRIYSPDD